LSTNKNITFLYISSSNHFSPYFT